MAKKRPVKTRQKIRPHAKTNIRKKPAQAKTMYAAKRAKIEKPASKMPVLPSVEKKSNMRPVYFWLMLGIAFDAVGVIYLLPDIFAIGIAFLALGFAKKYNWPKKKL
jgi:hypothetical protein